MNNKIIHNKFSHWKIQHGLEFTLFLVCSVVCFLILRHWNQISVFSVSILFIIIVFFSYRFYQYRPRLNLLINALNEEIPELEFSTSILIKDFNHLKTLEKLQVEKLEHRISRVKWSPPWKKMLLLTSIFSLVLLTFFTLISGLSVTEDQGRNHGQLSQEDNQSKISKDEILLEDIQITVTPPPYSLTQPKRQSMGPINILEGSQVKWDLQLSGEPDSLSISISGKNHNIIELNAYKEVFYESAFFQIIYGNTPELKLSAYHPITVVKDEKPAISISDIQEYTIMPYDASHLIQFNVEIQDDYQINDAFISATVAKGSGESVKFREKRIEIPGFKKGKSLKSNCTLSVEDLNMEPGSELYFYISAQDNCPFRTNNSKSLIYIFVFEDTTNYDVWDDGGMQVDLMPDFFRSQRQIIIDSEQLLKEQAKISTEEFNQRSNELGFDQKQLRLKYGQFLGEETESGIAIEPEIEELNDHDHHEGPLPGENKVLDWGREVLEQFGHDHDHENEEGQRFEEAGTVAKEDPSRPSWVEELSHNHDNAEMNTFYELPVKSKLKAALSQMWDSELHLRLYDPKSSLPYQYRALKLLQQIKDHARIYVHRLGFDPPIIKEEKRLSGEMDEITSSTLESERNEESLITYLRELNHCVSSINVLQEKPVPFDVKSKMKNLADRLSTYASSRLDLLPLLSSLQEIIQSEKPVTQTDVNKLQNKILSATPEEQPKSIRYNQGVLSDLKSDLIDLYKTLDQ